MLREIVLIVDDEEINRMVVSMQLQRIGVRSHTANDGTEALKLAESNDYLVILMDVQMPNMDGLEATRAIRQLQKTRGCLDVRIIAMTASPDKQRCFDAGMDDFLFKPVLLDTLRERIDRATRELGGVDELSFRRTGN
jgi:CheY-like chemotaxis protein